MPIATIAWVEDRVRIIDQTQLPSKLVYLDIDNYHDLATAIKRLCIRGAPAIGIAAAYGVVLGALGYGGWDRREFRDQIRKVVNVLAASRPTAVNLFWALERMNRVLEHDRTGTVDELTLRLKQEADAIRKEDDLTCRRIGENGAALVREGASILTHCNAGGLATGGLGTALSVMYVAWEQGTRFSVYADETRPLLQGARLTAWELEQAGIPVTLICDNMAASVMRQGRISMVVVGADRIAANGDTANKIGTYGIAVLARQHSIPFYVAAPAASFDLSITTGAQIPIEERDPEEVRTAGGTPVAPAGVPVYNPAFDVTEAGLITGIITEYGVINHPNRDAIKAMVGSRGIKGQVFSSG